MHVVTHFPIIIDYFKNCNICPIFIKHTKKVIPVLVYIQFRYLERSHKSQQSAVPTYIFSEHLADS